MVKACRKQDKNWGLILRNTCFFVLEARQKVTFIFLLAQAPSFKLLTTSSMHLAKVSSTAAGIASSLQHVMSVCSVACHFILLSSSGPTPWFSSWVLYLEARQNCISDQARENDLDRTLPRLCNAFTCMFRLLCSETSRWCWTWLSCVSPNNLVFCTWKNNFCQFDHLFASIIIENALFYLIGWSCLALTYIHAIWSPRLLSSSQQLRIISERMSLDFPKQMGTDIGIRQRSTSYNQCGSTVHYLFLYTHVKSTCYTTDTSSSCMSSY